ncbi:MAG TPA: hypothetical protein VN436_00560, partial [Holophaga sp.]|nr:hypothetical protein [Holophaga sp.]
MHLTLREICYLALLAGTIGLFQKLKRRFWIFTLATLPGTFCHELCHLCIGGLLNGQPAHFTIWPRRGERSWTMGSVSFSHVRWYNAFFMGMAPLLLLPAAYWLLAWRLGEHPAFAWREGLWLYLLANLVHASLPSWQDCRVAFRSPVGWVLLGAGVVFGAYRCRSPRPTVSL